MTTEDQRTLPSGMTERLAVIFVFLTVAIDVIAFGIVGPVLPGLIMELTQTDISGAAVWSGVLLFTYALMQFLFAPIIGNLSDAIGRRPVLLLSLAALSVDFVLMALAPNIWFLLIGRALAGIFGATAVTANAYIADITPPEERAGRFGLLGAAWGIGFIVGPILGGLLGDIDLRWPFYAAAIIAFLNFIYGTLVLPETLPKDNRREFSLARANTFGTFNELRKFPHIPILLGALILYYLAHDSLPAVWSWVNIEKFDWEAREIGYSMAAFGIATSLVMAFLTPVATRRLGTFRTTIIGLVSGIVGFTVFAVAPTELILFSAVPIFALWGMVMPSLRAIMSTMVPDNAQGELQGALTSLMSLTAIFAPLVMTGLFKFATAPDTPLYFPGAPFLLAALLLLACALIVIRTLTKATLATQRT